MGSSLTGLTLFQSPRIPEVYVKSQWSPSRTLSGIFFFFPFLFLLSFEIEFYYIALAGLELVA